MFLVQLSYFKHFSAVKCLNCTFITFAHAIYRIPIPNNHLVCSQGRALLHWACDRGHKELVSVLLQHKADINGQVSGIFPLFQSLFLRRNCPSQVRLSIL